MRDKIIIVLPFLIFFPLVFDLDDYIYIYINNSMIEDVGTQSICPLWRAGSGMLMVQRPELLSPHGFVLFASVGMLCVRVPHRLEKRPTYAL